MCQRQSQEEHRQQEARRVDRDRQLQACLRDEESSERRRYLRQVQEELKERQMESALLKVGVSVTQAAMLPLSVIEVLVTSSNLCPRPSKSLFPGSEQNRYTCDHYAYTFRNCMKWT